MPNYTTGEIAKICGVSVRTVQYYDSRGILIPSEFSEGGRRIYSEEDLRRMKIICFLRELDLPIDSIKKLLNEDHPEKVISILLDEQESLLINDIAKLKGRSDKISSIRQTLKTIRHFSVDSIADIAHITENKNKLKRIRLIILILGIVMDVIEIYTLFIWITKGIWVPFIIGLPVIISLGLIISMLYYKNTVYICPECHAIFRPKLGEMFWARHTPNTRRLHCTGCNYHGFCVETYGKDKNAENN